MRFQEVAMSAGGAPIDPVSTQAWASLTQHLEELHQAGISLKRWFAEDPERTKRFSYDL